MKRRKDLVPRCRRALCAWRRGRRARVGGAVTSIRLSGSSARSSSRHHRAETPRPPTWPCSPTASRSRSAGRASTGPRPPSSAFCPRAGSTRPSARQVSSLDFGLWYQTIDAGLLLADGTIVYATSVAKGRLSRPAGRAYAPAGRRKPGSRVRRWRWRDRERSARQRWRPRSRLGAGRPDRARNGCGRRWSLGGAIAARRRAGPELFEDGVATASVPDAGVARTVVVKPDGGVSSPAGGGTAVRARRS